MNFFLFLKSSVKPLAQMIQIQMIINGPAEENEVDCGSWQHGRQSG